MKLKESTNYNIEFARGVRITMSSIKINEMVTEYYKACVLRFFPVMLFPDSIGTCHKVIIIR